MDIYDSIEKIKTHKWKRPWLDFTFFSYDRGALTIVGSYDFSYYHNVEIKFILPEFIDGVTEWSCDVSEKFINYSSERKTIAFYADGERKIKIIAEEISVNFDTVFYYPRENLTDGQRLAYWLK